MPGGLLVNTGPQFVKMPPWDLRFFRLDGSGALLRGRPILRQSRELQIYSGKPALNGRETKKELESILLRGTDVLLKIISQQLARESKPVLDGCEL